MMMGDFEEAVMDAREWKAKCRKLEAELAALKAKAHDVASVPDGYGPTHKMVLAGERQWELSGNESPDCAAIYRAMIAAAPAQPGSAKGGEHD